MDEETDAQDALQMILQTQSDNANEEEVKPTPTLEVHVVPQSRQGKLVSLYRICFAVAIACMSTVATYSYFKNVYERDQLSNEIKCNNAATINVNQANAHGLTLILQALEALGKGDTEYYNELLESVPKVVTEMKDATYAQEIALKNC